MIKKVQQIRTPIKSNKIIKPGQYSLHLLLQQSTQLHNQNNAVLDIIIMVKTFDSKLYSKVKNNVGYQQCFWGQHFYFQKKFDDTRQFQFERLVISVYNHNKILNDNLIGDCELDVSNIYIDQVNKTPIIHKWIALTNPQKNYKQITGYIKISISCVGQQDQNIQLKSEPISNLLDEKRISIPPSVQKNSYQLIIKLYKGKDLKPADGETVDSYFSIALGSNFILTQPVKKNNNPDYNFIAKLPITLPTFSDKISLRLYDHNLLLKNQLLGSYVIKMNELKQKKYLDPTWIHFYGPQLKAQNDNLKKFYAKIPELASYYCGSVLCSINLNKNSNPIKSVNELREKLVAFKPKIYKIKVQIYDAINLQQPESKYKIILRIGNSTQESQIKTANSGWVEWFQQITLKFQFYQKSVIPDLFIYLVDKKQKQICFVRIAIQNGDNKPPKYYDFVPDVSILQKQQTGIIKIGYSISQMSKDQKIIRSSKLKVGNLIQGRLICSLYSAHSLLPKDVQGTSDPFFVFSYKKTIGQSETIQATLNPIYYQNMELPKIQINQNSNESPPIIVNVYDKDAHSREFIGQLVIDVANEVQNSNNIDYLKNIQPLPKWYQIKNNKIIAGKVLLSFRFLSYKSTVQISRHMFVPTKSYSIQIFVLGLRDLRSIGIFPIKKPFLQFDFKSLNKYNYFIQDSLTNRIQMLDEQSNQTRKIMSVKVDLPQDKNFWPLLSVRVKNYILGKFHIQDIGYFSIDLVESEKRSRHYVSQNLKRIQDIKKEKIVNIDKSQANKDLKYQLDDLNKDIIQKIKFVLQKTLIYKWKAIDKKFVRNSNLKIFNNKQKLIRQSIILYPLYQQVQQNKIVQVFKSQIQHKSDYIIVGHDKRSDRLKLDFSSRNRHYRFALKTTIQNYFKLMYGYDLGFFQQIQIRTGKKLVQDDFATYLLKKVNTQDTYIGLFKGNCFVTQTKNIKNQDEIDMKNQGNQNRIQKLQQNKESRFQQNFAKTQKFVLFIYVLQGLNLRFKTDHADSYLSFKFGSSKTKNTRQRFIKSEPNPKYLQKVIFTGLLPAQSILIIQVWNKNSIFDDALIGFVKIDIQNRLNSQGRQIVGTSPIETFQLKNQTSKINQGQLKLWLDIVPQQKIKFYKQFNIQPLKKEKFQVRIVIYGCENLPIVDFTQLADYFVSVQYGKVNEQTDVHYRTAHVANFNWRIIFQVQLPQEQEVITFKVKDKQLVGNDNFIASANFPILEYLTQAYQNQKQVMLFLGQEDLTLTKDIPSVESKISKGKKLYNIFNIPLKCSENSTQLGFEDPHLTLQIEILPISKARQRPVGKGRQNPNQYPKLKDPSGRKSWSLNPFTLLTQLCGKNLKYQIMCLLCLVVFGILFYDVLYSTIGNLIGWIIHG